MPTEVVPGVQLDTIRSVIRTRMSGRCQRTGIDLDVLEQEVAVKILQLGRGRSPYRAALSSQFTYVEMVANGVLDRIYRQQRRRSALFTHAITLNPELCLGDATRNLDDGGADMAIALDATRKRGDSWREVCAELEVPHGRGRLRRKRNASLRSAHCRRMPPN